MSSAPEQASSPGASVEAVRKIAELARLDLSGEEEKALAGQFANILAQFQVLARLDVSGVEAMVGGSRASDVYREDHPRPSLPAEAMLRNAPAHTAEFYVVPKTVGGAE
jgi:aspartyl-tRNA(Asn)/glutamyl-tRNA(Gln) amidotransferase subunit C